MASSAIAQSEPGAGGDSQPDPNLAPFLILMGGASVVSLLVMRRRGLLRAGGLDKNIRDCGGVGAIVWLTGAATIFVMTYFGAIIGLAVSQQSGFEQASLAELGLTSLGTYVVSIAAAAALIVAMRPMSTRAGFVVKPRDLAVGPLIFLLILPTVWVVSVLSTEIAAEILTRSGEAPPEELGHETLRALSDGSGVWWWMVTLGAVVGAPIIEEIIYRGFLQSALRRAKAPGWMTVIIVSVLFTGVHVGSADPWTLPSLFVLSLCLGASMEVTGRIGVPILIHAVFNGTMLAIAEFVV